MYKKIVLVFVLGFALLGAGSALAHNVATTTNATSAPIVVAENTLPTAGLTPLSPFYFLDRVGDWARVNFFFFNPVKRAEVIADVANERLAELKEVSSKAPQKIDVIEGLENAVAKRMGEVRDNLEKFSAENKKVTPLFRKMENLSLNSQKVMENMLLKNLPKKIKDGTEKRLKAVYKVAQQNRGTLMRQKERGLISGAEVEKLMNERMERMKKQIEVRSERVDKIKDPVLREKIKGIMAEKLSLLEDDVFSSEATGENGGSEATTTVGKTRRGVIKAILRAKQRMMIKGATSTDEILRVMSEGKIDFKERAGELIEKVKEVVVDAQENLSKMGTTSPQMLRSVKVLLATANKRLTAAKEAFDSGKYRVAFGQAMSAVKISRVVEQVLERRGEIKEGFEHMDRGQREELKKEMERRGENIKERMEKRREILKEKMKERIDNGGMGGDILERGTKEHGDKAEKIREIINKRAGERQRIRDLNQTKESGAKTETGESE